MSAPPTSCNSSHEYKDQNPTTHMFHLSTIETQLRENVPFLILEELSDNSVDDIFVPDGRKVATL